MALSFLENVTQIKGVFHIDFQFRIWSYTPVGVFFNGKPVACFLSWSLKNEIS
jgi:hypothetical protein